VLLSGLIPRGVAHEVVRYDAELTGDQQFPATCE